MEHLYLTYPVFLHDNILQIGHTAGFAGSKFSDYLICIQHQRASTWFARYVCEGKKTLAPGILTYMYACEIAVDTRAILWQAFPKRCVSTRLY